MQEVCNMFGGVCVANSHLYLHQLTGNMVDVSAAALSVPRKCHPDIATSFFSCGNVIIACFCLLAFSREGCLYCFSWWLD